jgi:alpha-tubulin suppressor-like RCC1 family protein
VLAAVVAALGITSAHFAATSRAATTMAAWGENSRWDLGAGYRSPRSLVPVAVLDGISEVTGIAAGSHSTLALLSDGTVRGWGGNLFGQLGDGSHQESIEPVSPVGLSGVSAIAEAGDHAMALLDDGTVMTWGGDIYGQLGNGTSGGGSQRVASASMVPVHVTGLGSVTAISAGGGDDFALLRNGTLAGWGENKDGQLGDGTTVERDLPTPVPGLSGVRAVSVGGLTSVGGHTVALMDDGTVRTWGADTRGALGNGSVSKKPITAPVTVPGLTDVVAVSAGAGFDLALRSDGTVWAWGSNLAGQLGLGVAGPEMCGTQPCSTVPREVPSLTGVTAIRGGFETSLAISDGSVRAWGANKYGLLGDGTLEGSDAPVAVGPMHDVTAVAVGEQHSVAILSGEPLGGGELPPPPVSLAPGAASLTVSWEGAPGPSQANWVLRWRPRSPSKSGWSKLVLGPQARGYTIEGLASVPYEVWLRNNTCGDKYLVGTPLQGAGSTALTEEPIAEPQPVPSTPQAPAEAPSEGASEAPAGSGGHRAGSPGRATPPLRLPGTRRTPKRPPRVVLSHTPPSSGATSAPRD